MPLSIASKNSPYILEKNGVDGFRYAVIEFRDEDLEKYMREACREVAESIEDLDYEDKLSKTTVKKIARCDEDALYQAKDILREEYGYEHHIPDYDEKAVEILINKIRTPDIPMAQVAESSDDLPPYSLYWNPDIRSFTGRWTTDLWGEDLDELGLCFAFTKTEEECKKILDLAEEKLNQPELINRRLKGENIHRAILIWRE